MSHMLTHNDAGSVVPSFLARSSVKSIVTTWAISVAALSLVAAGVIEGPRLLASPPAEVIAVSPPVVSVAVPVQRSLATRVQFLGQFSAVQNVELRPQVGGALTQIGFKDGDIVQKGDLLFQIDPTPYEIKLSEATAQLETAHSRLDLAKQEFFRADSLKKTGYGSIEIADQRAAEQRAAQAAVNNAEASIRDAQFDLDHTRITAPFTGRIGTHQVSIGNLISGSRAGTTPTTLLATLVSTDSIYLNFDMSEADYMTFLRNRHEGAAVSDKVQVSLADEKTFTHEGTLDFIDNTLDRSSGTIHARATIRNSDGLLTPGGFARVRLEVAPPSPTFLLPDVAVLPDQSEHIVMTVGPQNVVAAKHVQVGDLRNGLRVIHSGLDASDRVIVDNIPVVHVGATVAPHATSVQFASDQN
jgi:multidrug efflux system membrane fusion protein